MNYYTISALLFICGTMCAQDTVYSLSAMPQELHQAVVFHSMKEWMREYDLLSTERVHSHDMHYSHFAQMIVLKKATDPLACLSQSLQQSMHGVRGTYVREKKYTPDQIWFLDAYVKPSRCVFNVDECGNEYLSLMNVSCRQRNKIKGQSAYKTLCPHNTLINVKIDEYDVCAIYARSIMARTLLCGMGGILSNYLAPKLPKYMAISTIVGSSLIGAMWGVAEGHNHTKHVYQQEAYCQCL